MKSLLTLLTGFVGGMLFIWLHIPLPWVLGSFFATALVGQLGGGRLSMPGSWRNYAMVAIGTMLGAGFDNQIAARLVEWIPSMIVMLVLSFLFFLLPYVVLRRWSGMDKATALLAAMPGGLSFVTAIADDFDADSRRIALAHTARLIILLVMTPFMLGWIADYDLAAVALGTASQMELTEPLQLLWLVLGAAAGFVLARRLPVPSGLLLFPMIISAVLHGTGLVTVHVPGPVSTLAQIVIGSGIGLRFEGYRLRDIVQDGWLSAALAVFMSLGAFAGAYVYGKISGEAIPPLLLSFLPGGAPELGVVALALHVDPAMVAAHHLIRVMAIAAMVPLAMRFLAGRK